jgi:hypothetical protein
MTRGRRAGASVTAMSPRRIAEPKLVLLAVGALLVILVCILAIGDSADALIVLLTALVIAAIGGAIVLDLRRVIGASGGDAPEPVEAPPGHAIVVSTMPMTAAEVLDALGPGDTRSVMVVCPAGLTGAGLIVDDHDYARAHRAEGETVAALRAAGVNAAGQVGDRNPAHAIADALALFPAGRVVVVAHGLEADVYREHLDAERLRSERRVDLDVREVAAAE